MNGEALLLSLRLAATVSIVLLVVAMPVAYWLSFTSWRGKFLLESVVALPLVLPPTVLGFYALVALGSRGPLGRLWQTLFGHPLAFTFTGLVLASLVYSFPFAVQPLVTSFEGLDRRLLDASAILGAGKWRTFFRIILPQAIKVILPPMTNDLRTSVGVAPRRIQASENTPPRVAPSAVAQKGSQPVRAMAWVE